MGMNNWGGVTEHMSKKPRKAFEMSKSTPKYSKDKNATIFIDEKKSNRIRRNKFIKSFLIWIVGTIALFGLFLYYN